MTSRMRAQRQQRVLRRCICTPASRIDRYISGLFLSARVITVSYKPSGKNDMKARRPLSSGPRRGPLAATEMSSVQATLNAARSTRLQAGPSTSITSEVLHARPRLLAPPLPVWVAEMDTVIHQTHTGAPESMRRVSSLEMKYDGNRPERSFRAADGASAALVFPLSGMSQAFPHDQDLPSEPGEVRTEKLDTLVTARKYELEKWHNWRRCANCDLPVRRDWKRCPAVECGFECGEDGVARKLPRIAPEATLQEPLPRHLDEKESKAAASELTKPQLSMRRSRSREEIRSRISRNLSRESLTNFETNKVVKAEDHDVGDASGDGPAPRSPMLAQQPAHLPRVRSREQNLEQLRPSSLQEHNNNPVEMRGWYGEPAADEDTSEDLASASSFQVRPCLVPDSE